MKAISFGWTCAPLLAGVKTVTRRTWKPAYAATFKAGEIVQALDKDRRYGGTVVGLIRLLDAPRWEPDADAPDSDYEAEGFAWMDAHRKSVPAAALKQARVTLTFAAFDAWRKAGGSSWVIRFEPVKEGER